MQLRFLFFLLLFGMACTDDSLNNINPDEYTIWSGATITFEKADGADPSLADNQDRITNNVWITRGNDGGQIYNAVSEEDADKDNSPAGTLWARGTTAELDQLTFGTFRDILDKPKDAIGENLVMLLTEDNIAIDITITSWSGNRAGGFAYERSSSN